MIRSSSASCQRNPSTPSIVKSRPSSSASTKRYSIKYNQCSEIDELLFGPSKKQENNNHATHQSSVILRPQSSAPQRYDCFPRSKLLRVVSQDTVRHLYKKPEAVKNRSLTLSQMEYKRLLNYAEPEKLIGKIDSGNMTNKKAESMQRKLEMAHYDNLRLAKPSFSFSDNKNAEETRNLIRRAWESRVDDEAEVREVNNMIKVAKVQTIRDKQVKEKQLIRELSKEEDTRIDRLIEKENVAQIERQQELDRMRLKKEYIAAHSMVAQIQDNQRRKLEELDLLAAENLEAKQAVERAINNNMMDKQIRVEQQRRKHVEAMVVNKAVAVRKLVEKMQEKLLEEQVMKIQLENAEKEKIKEEEIIRKKQQREIEYAKLRAMQEKIKDLQSQRDELMERRAVEDSQRKWRQQELEEETRKKEAEEELQMIRTIQRHMSIVRNAREATRERDIFLCNVQREKTIMEKDRMEEETKQNKKHKFAREIIQQIERNKVQGIVDDYRRKLEEAQLVQYDELRQRRIQEAQIRKLDESRSMGIAEKYLLHIENRINNPTRFIRH